jgi:hypothetical protein
LLLCLPREADGLWRSLVSALRSGRRGPRFKSGQPDQKPLVRASGFWGAWLLRSNWRGGGAEILGLRDDLRFLVVVAEESRTDDVRSLSVHQSRRRGVDRQGHSGIGMAETGPG